MQQSNFIQDALSATDISRVSRRLTNPDLRVPLRPDFPPIMSLYEKDILGRLLSEMGKLGRSQEDAPVITIAYPHKNPQLHQSHKDEALQTASELAQRLKAEAGDISVQVADAICENVHLNRSGDQSARNTLINRQEYAVNLELQQTPLDFIDPTKAARKHFFVIADWIVEQGTTVANLASFIEHNGGHVLGVVTRYDSGQSLKQPLKKAGFLSRLFNPSAAVVSTLAVRLGQELAAAALRESVLTTPSRALELLDEGLRRHGKSVNALTAGECAKLASRLVERSVGYHQLADLLNSDPVKTPGQLPTQVQPPVKSI